MEIKLRRIFVSVVVTLVIGYSFTNRIASADHLPPIFSVIPFLWPHAPGIPQHGNINIDGDGSFGGNVIFTAEPGAIITPVPTDPLGHDTVAFPVPIPPFTSRSLGSLMWMNETHQIAMNYNGVDGPNYFDLVNFAGDLSDELYAWRFRDSTGNTLMQINTKGG